MLFVPDSNSYLAGIRSVGSDELRLDNVWRAARRCISCHCSVSGVASPNLPLCILISSMGRSLLSVRTASSRCTVFIPNETRPNIVCFPSRKGVGAYVRTVRLARSFCEGNERTHVMKNCDPVLISGGRLSVRYLAYRLYWVPSLP